MYYQVHVFSATSFAQHQTHIVFCIVVPVLTRARVFIMFASVANFGDEVRVMWQGIATVCLRNVSLSRGESLHCLHLYMHVWIRTRLFIRQC